MPAPTPHAMLPEVAHDEMAAHDFVATFRMSLSGRPCTTPISSPACARRDFAAQHVHETTANAAIGDAAPGVQGQEDYGRGGAWYVVVREKAAEVPANVRA